MDKLDLTKPIRVNGEANKDATVTILATGIVEKLPDIRATFEGGETILARIDNPGAGLSNKESFVAYYYADGRMSRYEEEPTLVNYVPPVVVRGRRDIEYYPGTVGEKFASNRYKGGNTRATVGVVEFTVTDGKLTNVEIINED